MLFEEGGQRGPRPIPPIKAFDIGISGLLGAAQLLGPFALLKVDFFPAEVVPPSAGAAGGLWV
jgi:hypothetical protein